MYAHEVLVYSGLLLVYENSEILFEQLNGLLKKYESWVRFSNISRNKNMIK